MPNIITTNRRKELKLKKSILFNPYGTSDDYVSLGDVHNFERTDAFSFSCWIKSPSSTEQCIIAKMGESPNVGYQLYLSSTGTIKYTLVNNSSTNLLEVETAVTVNDYKWHFISATYDGSSSASGVHIYVDGVEVSFSIVNNTLSSSIITASELQFGARVTSATRRFFVGHLSNIAFWNKELSLSEVTTIYNNGSPSDLESLSFSDYLVGWWTLGAGDTYPTITDHKFGIKSNDTYPKIIDSNPNSDSFSGYPVVNDISINNYSGIMTNMDSADVVEDSPGGTFSELSFSFDGVNDYITMGNVLDFDPSDTFSISTWFKKTNTGSSAYLVSKFDSTPTGWGVRVLSTGEVEIITDDGLVNQIEVKTTETGFDDSEWHHVVVTIAGSGSASGITIYADGTNKPITIVSDDAFDSIKNTGSLNISGRSNGLSQLLLGNVSDTAIYNKELSYKEVVDIFNSGAPTDNRKLSSSSNLIGYWALGQINSTRKYNGIMTNMSINDIVLDSPGGIFSKFSIDFDGSNDYVGMGNILGFEYNDAFSCSCWFKTTVSSGYLCSKREGVAGNYKGWGAFVEGGTDGSIGFSLTNNASSETRIRTVTNGFNDDNWHHCVITYDGSSLTSGMKCYIDDIDLSLTTIANSIGTNTIINTAGFNIGARSDGESIFNGNISDVSIYNKELSSVEASEIYNSGVPTDNTKLSTKDNLVGYWRLGSQIRFDGILTNGSDSSIINNYPESGNNYSLNFPGTGYIKAGNILDFDINDRFSISYWIKTNADDGYVVSKMDGTYTGWACGAGNGYPEFMLINTESTNELRVKSLYFVGDYDWHHICFVYDGYNYASGISLYIDGAEDTSKTTEYETLTGSISNSAEFNIGSINNGTGLLNGIVDNVSIYHGELTSSEVLQLYRNSASGKLNELNSADKLIGWWRMGDEFVSTTIPDNKNLSNVSSAYPTIIDLSGNSYHGTMTNMSIDDIVMDYPGGQFSMTFDGSNDYITMGDILGFDNTDKFSFSLWFKTTASSDYYLLSKMDSTPTGYAIYIGSTGGLALWLHSNATNRLGISTTTSGYNDGNWHHVVITYSGGESPSSVNIYVDGIIQPTGIDDNDLTTTITNTGSFQISGRTGTIWNYSGQISNVSIYNKELSSTEALSIYNNRKYIDLLTLSSSTNLVGWWRLGNGDTYPTATDNRTNNELITSIYPTISDARFSSSESAVYPTVNDLSGNGYDGTMTSMSANDIVLDSPGGTFSKFSMIFDSTDYIKFGNNLNFSKSDVFSISAWIKNIGNSGYIVGKADGTVNGWALTGRDLGATTHAEFRLLSGPGGEDVVRSSIDINDGNWHHTLVTYDGSGDYTGAKFYIDGTYDTSPVVVVNTLTGDITNSAELNIGTRNNGSSGFIGSITDVSIYNKILSYDEAIEIYNSGNPTDNTQLSSSTNLVGYWRLGSTMRFDGTMTNMSSNDIVFDYPNGYMSTSFDGTDDYITMGDVLGFERTDIFSISFWVKCSAGTYPVIMKQEGSSPYLGYSIWIESNYIRFDLMNNTTTNALKMKAAATSVATSEWVHIVCTYDGSSLSSGINIYINGVDQSLTTIADTLSASIINTYDFQFGKQGARTDWWYSGYMSNVAVYNKKLSSIEISEIYNNGSYIDLTTTSVAPSLLAWWKLGNGDAYPTASDNNLQITKSDYPTVLDSGWHGYHGTMTNMATNDIVLDSPYNGTTRSLTFDGSNDYVTMGDVLGFERTDAFSVSFWFKKTVNGTVIAKLSLSSGTGWLVFVAPSIRFGLQNSWSTRVRVHTDRTFSDDIWHHGVCTYDGSGLASGVSIYTDGVLEPSTVITDNLGSNTILNTETLTMGAYDSGAEVDFSGNLNNIAVYNKELSSSEVEEIYNNGDVIDLATTSVNDYLVGWWRMGYGDTYPTIQDNRNSNETLSAVYPTIVDTKITNENTSIYPTIADSSGNGYTGTMTNMTTNDIVLDSPGGTFSKFSVNFDNVGDYITMGNVLNFERTDTFSFSAWFKSTASDYDYIIAKTVGSPNYTGYFLCVDGATSGVIRIGLNSVSGVAAQVYSVSTGWNDNNWHHAVFTYNGNSDVSGFSLYVDGVTQALTTSLNTLTSSIITTAELNISGRTNGAVGIFNGNIGDVSIYDKELTYPEAQEIYNSGIPTDNTQLSTSNNLLAYWRLGSTIRYDGTMTNMATNDIVLDSPGGTFSKFSVNFDGVNDYIDLGNVLNFERTDSFSMCAWINPSTTGDLRIISNQGVPDNGWVVGTNGNKLRVLFLNTWMTNLIFVETTSTVIPTNTWTHICFTYDGSSNATGLKLYVNSSDTAKTTIYNNLSGTIVSAANLNIGRDPRPYGYFSGNICDVSIYNKELSLSEVQAIYNSGIPTDNVQLSSSDNLVGYWRLGDLIDFDGTMTNMASNDIVIDSPASVSNKKNSLVFDGTNDYITMGNILDFERTVPFSISCWFKKDVTSTFTYLVSKYDSNPVGWGLKVNNTGQLEMFLYNTGITNEAAIQTVASNFDDGNWYHAVSTYDGSSNANGMKIYVNGSLESTTVVQNTLSGSISNNGSLNISGRTNGASQIFSGNISNVSIWNKELSADEVSEIFNYGTPNDLMTVSTAPYLLGWWRLGEDVKFNGTMTNMTSTDIILDSYDSSKTNNASITFDGSNDYVTMGNVLNFERTDTFSISCWFKASSIGSTRYLITKKGSGTGWWLGHYSNGDIGFTFWVDGTNRLSFYSTTKNIGVNIWANVIFTYDGSSTAAGCNIYINGVADTLTGITDNLSSNISNTAALIIADREQDLGTGSFVGNISNVSIYNKELSAIEAQEIFNSGIPIDNTQLSSSSNILGYWKLGDDIRFDGTMTNMSVEDIVNESYYLPPRNDFSITFDGTDDLINMGDVLGFERTDSFSISAWFKTTDTSGIIFSKQNHLSPWTGYLMSILSSKIDFELVNSGVGGSNMIAVQTISTFNDGIWHHVCCTYDGSSSATGVTIYVDGSLKSTSTINNSLSSSILNSEDAMIGARDSTSWLLNGNISDVSVYNKELSLDEITSIYNSGVPTDNTQLSSASNLVGYWRTGKDTRFDGTMVTVTDDNFTGQSPTYYYPKYVTSESESDLELTATYQDAFSASMYVDNAPVLILSKSQYGYPNSSGGGEAKITRDGNIIHHREWRVQSTGNWRSGFMVWVDNPTNGLHEYKLQGRETTGTQRMDNPGQFSVIELKINDQNMNVQYSTLLDTADNITVSSSVSWTELLNVDITTSGGDVLLTVAGNTSCSTAGISYFSYRLTRDGDEIYFNKIARNATNDYRSMDVIFLDKDVSSGEHIYVLEALISTNAWEVFDFRQLAAIELRVGDKNLSTFSTINTKSDPAQTSDSTVNTVNFTSGPGPTILLATASARATNAYGWGNLRFRFPTIGVPYTILSAIGQTNSQETENMPTVWVHDTPGSYTLEHYFVFGGYGLSIEQDRQLAVVNLSLEKEGRPVAALPKTKRNPTPTPGPEPSVWTPDDWGADRLLDYSGDDVLLSGSNITTFTDKTGGGLDATQGNSAYQATISTSYSSLNNQSVADWGTGDWYDLPTTGLSTNVFTMFLIFDISNNSSLQYFGHGPDGTMSVNSGGTMYYKITWSDIHASGLSTGASSTLWVADGSSSQFYTYVNGANNDTPVSKAISILSDINPRGMVGRTGSGSSGLIAPAAVARYGLLNRVPTSEDVTNFTNYAENYYGIIP